MPFALPAGSDKEMPVRVRPRGAGDTRGPTNAELMLAAKRDDDFDAYTALTRRVRCSLTLVAGSGSQLERCLFTTVALGLGWARRAEYRAGQHPVEWLGGLLRPLTDDQTLTSLVLATPGLDDEAADAAFRLVATRLWTPLTIFSNRLLGCCQSCGEDLAQHVIAKLWERRGSFRGEATVFTYCCRIAVNESLRARKSGRPRPGRCSWETCEEELIDLAAVDGGPDLLANATVVAALRQLPADERAVVFYRLYFDMTFEEIAAELGLNNGRQARARWNKACKRLRHLLPSPRKEQE